MIDREVFQAWKELDSTKEVFKVLMDFRQKMMESWADGQFSGDESVKASAQCQANQDLVNLNYETIKEFYGVTE